MVIRATDDLIETVIENVVDNALSVAPEGSGIEVALKKYGGQAELIVRDRGPGVPEPYLNRIFERYVSLRPKDEIEMQPEAIRARGGSGESADSHPGIGLWIVRRNLEALGGSVRAENRAEGGLAIIMSLPLAG